MTDVLSFRATTIAVALVASLVFETVVPIEGPASVVDGDTIDIGETRVRLWGLDAPELPGARGRAAKQTMIDIIAGDDVRCEWAGAVSYDRIVAQCFVRGADLAREMILAGAARPWCRYAGDFYDDAARQAGFAPCGGERR